MSCNLGEPPTHTHTSPKEDSFSFVCSLRDKIELVYPEGGSDQTWLRLSALSSTLILTPQPAHVACHSSTHTPWGLHRGVGGGYLIPMALHIPDVNTGDKWSTISGIRCRRGRFIR